MDLCSEISSTVSVVIYSKTNIQQSVTFNYTYHNVLPFVESFFPTAGREADGDMMSVRVKYFPYPTQNLTVRFGNYSIHAKISDSSNLISTLISFVKPPVISGIVEIEISRQDCTQLCKGRVSFLSLIKDSKGLVLAPPLPTSAAYQEFSELGMVLPIQIMKSMHISYKQKVLQE